MIDSDTELRLLEQEFPKSSGVWATDTDAALDKRILSIADRTAPYLAQQHMRKERERPYMEKSRGFPQPARPSGQPDTAERFRRFDRAKESSMSYDMVEKASMRTSSRKMENIPAGAEKILAFLKDAEQQIWLDRIAEFVKAGDIELATYLLRRYRSTFRGR